MREKQEEIELFDGVLDDEECVRTFLPGVMELQARAATMVIPECMIDPLTNPYRLGVDAEADRVAAHNARDERGGTLTVVEWRLMREAFAGCCAYCRRRLRRGVLEHVVPISGGGHTCIENVVPACGRCNRRKRQRSVEDWMGEQWCSEFRARQAAALAEVRAKTAKPQS